MSAVSAIRTTFLPRMVVCLEAMYECSQAISSQVDFALEEGMLSQIERLTRTHLIRCDILAERLLDDIRRVELLLEQDYTFAVLVHESDLSSHRPRRIGRDAWEAVVLVVCTLLQDGGDASEVLLTARWIALSIQHDLSAVFKGDEVRISGKDTRALEGHISDLAQQLDLILELFDALKDRVTIH